MAAEIQLVACGYSARCTVRTPPGSKLIALTSNGTLNGLSRFFRDEELRRLSFRCRHRPGGVFLRRILSTSVPSLCRRAGRN